MFTKILRQPALAIVISTILLFLGVLGIKTLPIAQFPDIAPPTVMVSISYPGASANVLVESVLIPLEQSINGVQNMRFISSSASSAGEAAIIIYFEPGTDPNINVVNVQNRVNIVLFQLPPLVVREGILVSQVVPSMLMYVNIYSTDPNADQKDLFNFANVYVMPRLKRIKGMGIPRNLGNRIFAMRVWLNPERMRAYNVSSDDVMKALSEQSVIGSPGRLGQATGKTSQSKEYVLTYIGRFNKPEQYESIILKSNPDGEILRLKDVGKVELGPQFFDIYSDINGHPAASIVLKQAPGSNAAEVIEEIKRELELIKKESFPPGMDYEFAYDVSKFLDASIEKVLHTLLEAFILVSLVVYMFLGDLRSTLIPTLAVPVSLVGTFFVLRLMGLSINLITLFAMVLAIGVVVDDAIVVVEAVHAKMAQRHLSPYRATMEVVHEISGAIIAITLVMTSVFVPVTFIPGAVGTFYRQFGITMATSIILSGLVALTLTPVLCAMILKPHSHTDPDSHTSDTDPNTHTSNVERPRGLGVKLLFALGGLLVLGGITYLAYELWGPVGFLLILLPFVRGPFDRAVEKVTGGYAAIVRRIATCRTLTMAVVGGFAVGIVVVNTQLPTGFIPGEDQGIIYAVLQTPPGSTLEYTNDKSQELEKIAKEIEEVTSVTSLAGYEVLTEGRGSNSGTCIINLKTWADRTRTARQIIVELEEKCRRMSNVKLEFFEPPAVPGFGTAGGISMLILDKTFSADYQRLGEITEKFMAALKKRKEVTNMFTFYAANYPQYELIIDNDKAMQKGVSIKAAMDNLNILIGSTWEQGFIRFNQFYKVFVQALPEFRRYPEDLENLFVKNDKGDMVPYSAFMTVKKKQGLNEITRYNLYTSAAIQCAPAAGYSTGQAIQAIKEIGADPEVLPRGFDIGWSGLSYDESRKGNEAVYIFLIVVAFVYLVLVGQYESFILPLAVILSLPVGLFGSFFFLQAMGLANDVYAQIGLVMLVGLLGKNAILIVEFAVQRRLEGVSLKEAAVEGAKLRFRPIQMTSFAFIAGLLPLVVATGAGAIGNRTIGTTGAGGMLVGTVIGVLVIPGLYYLFGKLDGGRKLREDEADEPLSEVFEHQAQEAHDGESTHDRDSNGLPLPCETAESPALLLSKPVFRRPFPLEIPESTEEKSTV
jgi:HAE1 family hydrophobic/amphiphilic exporter-1